MKSSSYQVEQKFLGEKSLTLLLKELVAMKTNKK